MDHQLLPPSPNNFALRPVVTRNAGASLAPPKDWPHAPVHRLTEFGVYMVTAGTLYKRPLFSTPDRLDLLERSLLCLAKQCHWQLEAWAVLTNHYHFVARGAPDSVPMSQFLKEPHSRVARELNRLDGCEGRGVWHNFWDTRLTYQYAYLARL